jgi:hypothetical protein
MRLNALFRLAFATATPPGLTSPHTTNSQAHSSKGTPSPYFPNGKVLGSDGLQADGFRHYFTPLPGYFSPFPHGTIRYRSPGSIQPYQMVLANSRQITGVRRYSRTLTHRPHVFTYRALTVYGAALTRLRLTSSFITVHRTVRSYTESLTTPRGKPLTGITPTRFRHQSAFARHYSRNHNLFSLPAGTEMFHFPAFPPTAL